MVAALVLLIAVIIACISFRRVVKNKGTCEGRLVQQSEAHFSDGRDDNLKLWMKKYLKCDTMQSICKVSFLK